MLSLSKHDFTQEMYPPFDRLRVSGGRGFYFLSQKKR
jgi:hypothetical protein